MVDITGLNTIQGVYKSPASGSKGQPFPQQYGSKHDHTTSLPNDTSAHSDLPPHDLQVPKTLDPSQRIDIFVVRDNVFSLYKLPNGQFFSKVRNLKTGEEQILPRLDSFTYFEAIRGNRGIFIEKDV